MGIVLLVLRLACVLLFTVSIPLMVRQRLRNASVPAWLLISLAIALGSGCPFAHKTLERPMHRAFDREERLAAEEYMRHPPPPPHPTRNAAGDWETAVDNPLVLGDWFPEDYHPVVSLLYGPAYLAICWVAGWVFSRRTPAGARRRILLISVGVLLAFWIAFAGYLINRPAIFNDGVLVREWNAFFGPQLTVPLALLIAWLFAGWLPSALAPPLGRVGK